MKAIADIVFVVCDMRYIMLLSLVLVVGCSDAEAEKVRLVGEKTYDRAAALAVQTLDELGRTLLDSTAATPKQDVVSRVHYRIQWDRDLQDSKLQVASEGETIVLRGQVTSEEYKERAGLLAEQTAGVSQVKNDIEVAKPAGDDTTPQKKPTTPQLPSAPPRESVPPELPRQSSSAADDQARQ